MGAVGGDGDTGQKATGLSDSCPRASGDEWENKSQCFPLVSRLNYVARKGPVRGKGTNEMAKTNWVLTCEAILPAECGCGNVQRQLKTQTCNSEKRSGLPERLILVCIKLLIYARGHNSTHTVFK